MYDRPMSVDNSDRMIEAFRGYHYSINFYNCYRVSLTTRSGQYKGQLITKHCESQESSNIKKPLVTTQSIEYLRQLFLLYSLKKTEKEIHSFKRPPHM